MVLVLRTVGAHASHSWCLPRTRHGTSYNTMDKDGREELYLPLIVNYKVGCKRIVYAWSFYETAWVVGSNYRKEKSVYLLTQTYTLPL